MTGFQECVDFVIDQLEGGDRIITDSGGVTKYGIAQKFHPDVDVISLTREQAIEIYRREYWDPAGCETMRPDMALVIFDCAVNQGLSVAKDIAVESLDAAEALLHRVSRYSDLANRRPSSAPLRGWINRCVKIWRTT